MGGCIRAAWGMGKGCACVRVWWGGKGGEERGKGGEGRGEGHLSGVAERMVSVRPCLKPAVDADSYVDPAVSGMGRVENGRGETAGMAGKGGGKGRQGWREGETGVAGGGDGKRRKLRRENGDEGRGMGG
jgi:hypothetical protein